MATTTSRANETRGTIDNNGTNPHAKFESMARRLYSPRSGNTQLDPTVVRLNEPVKQSAPKGGTSDPWRPGAAATKMRKMGSVTTTKTLAALYPSSSRRA